MLVAGDLGDIFSQALCYCSWTRILNCYFCIPVFSHLVQTILRRKVGGLPLFSTLFYERGIRYIISKLNNSKTNHIYKSHIKQGTSLCFYSLLEIKNYKWNRWTNNVYKSHIKQSTSLYFYPSLEIKNYKWNSQIIQSKD